MIKTFKEYIRTTSNTSRPLTNRDFCDKLYLESMKEYFGNDIPNSVYEAMQSGDYTDFILENLKSHDINLLCKKIWDMFGKDCPTLEFLPMNHKASSFQIVSYEELDEDKLKNIIEFFGYYITTSGQDEEDGEYYYIVSPKYASNANDLVYKENHGKLYHFSTGEYAKDIEKKGLRCKTSNYRYFPERIYAYASDKNLDEIPNIFDKIKDVVNPSEAKEYGIYVYRIDLNNKKGKYINFYEDDVMEYDDAVYTYNNIPPECITLIDIIEL